MEPIIIIVFGYVSGVLTTFAGIPQMVKVFRSSSTQDLSYTSLSMIVCGTCSWTIYGVLRNDSVIIVFNVLSFIIYVAILFFKFYVEVVRKDMLAPKHKYTELTTEMPNFNGV